MPVCAARVASCVATLAPPDSVEEVDIFRQFSDCLYIAGQQALDQLDPPTPEDYKDHVNKCMGLWRHGRPRPSTVAAKNGGRGGLSGRLGT